MSGMRKAPAPPATDNEIQMTARRVLEEIAAVGTGSEVPLEQYISDLAKYRQFCERNSNYKEAELVQHVLKQLRLEEENRHVYALTQQQEMERQGLGEAHLIEFQQFNQVWNKRIDDFEDQQLREEANTLEQHSMELAKFHGEMTAVPPNKPKFSKDLLNLRKIQNTLASQKNYVEAQKVKIKGDKLEEQERQRINRERGERYAKREAQILARHRQELLARRKKMESLRIELERARKKELELLLQRYNNVKRGLLGQQNILKAKTGNMLLKHAANRKTDTSGSAAIVHSMKSGTFGPGTNQRPVDESWPPPDRVMPPVPSATHAPQPPAAAEDPAEDRPTLLPALNQ